MHPCEEIEKKMLEKDGEVIDFDAKLMNSIGDLKISQIDKLRDELADLRREYMDCVKLHGPIRKSKKE